MNVLHEREVESKEKQWLSFSRHHNTMPLNALQPGTAVHIKESGSAGILSRTAATPKSYVVDTDKGTVRRNCSPINNVPPQKADYYLQFRQGTHSLQEWETTSAQTWDSCEATPIPLPVINTQKNYQTFTETEGNTETVEPCIFNLVSNGHASFWFIIACHVLVYAKIACIPTSKKKGRCCFSVIDTCVHIVWACMVT